MNILIIGDESRLAECRQKFGDGHVYTRNNLGEDAERALTNSDIVFDFLIDENPSRMGIYRPDPQRVVFLNTSKTNLTQLNLSSDPAVSWSQFGFAGMPTFLNREIFEVSLFKKENSGKLKEVCLQLNTAFQVVDDRVGLVTPRVIAMIINEAYFAVEDGTASREDIDMAMKLGTNYPFGPFEWCRKIGIRHVVELLLAVYEDTKDDRYKICPLLRKEYLES